MKVSPMYILALVYCMLVAAGMLYGLWQDQKYSGGNHWAFFGTDLDQLIQTLGIAGLMALTIPPGIAAISAFSRAYFYWGSAISCATLALAGLIYFFAITALD